MDKSKSYLNATHLTENLVYPLFHEKSLGVIDQFFSEEVDIQTTFISGKGPDILKKSLKDTFEIFPNLNVDISSVVQLGNKYIYKWQADALHAGSLLGIPATYQDIEFSGVVYGEIEKGYINTYHSFSNIPQVLQELSSKRIKSKDHEATRSNFSLLFSTTTKGASTFIEICQALRKLTRFPLTRREIECLAAWLKGCSIKESARRMGGLSERTIQTYRESIKKKFGVYNYQQVLYIIKDNGLLPHLL